ncbi:D-alanyl-D-alanine carboxypeptidase [Burkholderia pyrrocinia]|nr:D-alanyl-D-alanine carboxypeptidase [Burkholderia pyrrocinia]
MVAFTAQIGMHVVFLLTASAPTYAATPPEVNAISWMVVDGESSRVLAEHNVDERRQPASLTKLMTAYVVFDALKRGTLHWDEVVTVSDSALKLVGSDEARMYLQVGQKVSVRELVQGLIEASANDAAQVLAERTGGSAAGFEVLMNEAGRRLALDESHFSTPSGVTTAGHYSTARDIMRLAMRLTTDFPEVYSYSSKKHFVYRDYRKENKNPLLGIDPSVDGLKTGHTAAAGWCLVVTANRKQTGAATARRVFVVVMGARTQADRKTASKTLLDYAFSVLGDQIKKPTPHV